MRASQQELTGTTRGQVEAIVAGGNDVREQISRLVAETAQRYHMTPEGLSGLARSIMEGAVAGIQRALPPQPESALRQVVDGLGDGFTAVALAGKLTLEEAAARHKAFADEDLAKLDSDLKSLADLFVDTISSTAGAFKTITAGEAEALRRHAQQTLERARPSFDSALAAAREQPLQVARETARAGLSLTRQGLGALFSGMGKSVSAVGRPARS